MNVFLLSLIEPQQAKYIVHDDQIPRITFEGAQGPPVAHLPQLEN